MSAKDPHGPGALRPGGRGLLGAAALVAAFTWLAPPASAGLGRCSPFAAATGSSAYAEGEEPRPAVALALRGAPVPTPPSPRSSKQAGRTVDVYAHIIDPAGPADPLTTISAAQIEAQIGRLNEAFKGIVTFRLHAIDRAADLAWYTMEGGQAEIAAKSELHRGDASDLNIYYVGPGNGNWATFPWTYRQAPKMDGVVIRKYNHSPPDAPAGAPRVIGGEVGVHEVGHWLGLYHTFQGGCSTSNDLVEDTPAHLTDLTDVTAVTANPCFEGRDTCPAATGTDPVHNFMNYGGEACWTHFTRGQLERADAMWRTYRVNGG